MKKHGQALWVAWVVGLLVLAGPGCHAATQPAVPLRDEYRAFLQENRRPGALNPKVLSERKLGENVIEKVRITTEEGQDAVVMLMRPQREKRYPVVVLQHFLGGRKDDQSMMLLAGMLAGRGYLVAAIDARYRGERVKERSFDQVVEEALRTGKGRPWLVDTVYDVMRTIDYLVTRPDVDPDRIGMAGISEGGLITWMTAAADERIKVAAPMIGVTRFQYIVEQAAGPAGEAYRNAFQAPLAAYATQLGEKEINERVIRKGFEQLLPGYTERFDATKLVPLIAPRPLLILSHEKDEIIPLKGAEEVYAAAKERYTALSAADRLKFRVSPGLKHAALDYLEPFMMTEWFDRYLKGAGGAGAAR